MTSVHVEGNHKLRKKPQNMWCMFLHSPIVQLFLFCTPRYHPKNQNFILTHWCSDWPKGECQVCYHQKVRKHLSGSTPVAEGELESLGTSPSSGSLQLAKCNKGKATHMPKPPTAGNLGSC
jgi:hypothetical protein